MSKIKRVMTMNFKDMKYRESSNGEMIIEGYFALFNEVTKITENYYEVIMPGAFDTNDIDDVVAVFNHNSDLVLGSVKNNTLILTVDNIGLYGVVHINSNDTEALNIYHRVARGDISNASFAFETLQESVDYDYKDIYSDEFLVKVEKCKLHEITITPFPAYPSTIVFARSFEAKNKKNKLANKKQELKGKFKWL